jgi:hypothetical protein
LRAARAQSPPHTNLCGFPCDSDDLPPLILWPCYQRRRQIVTALGADEGSCETRAKVVFCCPCSELQAWLEIRASGVWPGLPCSARSADDIEFMTYEAVRRRYATDRGEYGVKAADPDNQTAQRLAMIINSTGSLPTCASML